MRLVQQFLRNPTGEGFVQPDIVDSSSRSFGSKILMCLLMIGNIGLFVTDIGFIGLRRTGVRETRQFSGRKVMKPFSELNRTTVLVLYWGLFGGGGKLRHGKSGCQVAAGWFGALPDCWETQGWRAWQRPSGQPVGCWRNSGGVRAHFQ